VALVAVAPDWIGEDEAGIGAAAAPVEVTYGTPGDAGLAGGEGGGWGCGSEGGHEGEEGGGELHGVCNWNCCVLEADGVRGSELVVRYGW